MRARRGKLNYETFMANLANSRIHELDSRGMTSTEMGIDPHMVNTLKTNEVIVSKGKVLNKACRHYYHIWGPGPKYRYWMKQWGWA